jgi:hypothetical protein
MEIQKEREAFKQHLTDTGLVEFAGYGFAVDECDEYLHEPTQVAWDSWLIGLNRAKAQSVPEGFVLVDKHQLAQLMANMDSFGKKALGDDYVSFADIAAVLDEAQEPAND